MLIHVIKHSVTYWNKQLKTDHKRCKIFPNTKAYLQEINYQLVIHEGPLKSHTLLAQFCHNYNIT